MPKKSLVPLILTAVLPAVLLIGCANAQTRIRAFFVPLNELLLVAIFYTSAIVVSLGLGEIMLSRVGNFFSPAIRDISIIRFIIRLIAVGIGIFVATQANSIVNSLLNFFTSGGD